MKRILLSTAFLFSVLSATAQYNPLQLGVQLSPSFSWMSTNNNLIESDGTKLGLKLGLLAEFYFQDNYSIHSGLNIHFGSGGALRYDDQFTTVNIWSESLNETFIAAPTPDQLGGSTFDYRLQWVEVPLGLTLRTREFGYLKYFVRPQVALGVLTNSRGTVEGVAGIDEDEAFNIGAETNPVNLSWGIGGGVEYAISTGSSLVGGVAFQSGLLDITTDNDTQLVRTGRSPAEDDSRGRVSSVTIMLGIMF